MLLTTKVNNYAALYLVLLTVYIVFTVVSRKKTDLYTLYFVVYCETAGEISFQSRKRTESSRRKSEKGNTHTHCKHILH